jgi:hypothetical protein
LTASWDTRSPEEQARVEMLTLSTWGPAATTAAPFWAARASDLAVSPEVVVDRDGLRRLPPARARDLLADAPGGAGTVLRPAERQVKALASPEVLGGVVRGIRRGGAGGKRDAILREYRPIHLHRAGGLVVASTRTDLDRMHRAGARAATVLGLQDDDVVLSAVPAGPSLDAAATAHLAAAASLPALHARGAGADLEEVAAAFPIHPATVLIVPVEDAVPLAEVFDAARVDLGRLRRIVTVGPPPGPDAREEVVAAFGRAGAIVDVRAVWGPPAGRVLWGECAAGSGLHTYPDLELLEVVDPFLGQVTGGDGDLTLTTIGWHGSVLLRFQTGTWVDPLAIEPCPSCGRTVPRVVGDLAPAAWELAGTAEDGQPCTIDLRGAAAVLATVPGVATWRCELRGPEARGVGDRLVVEVGGPVPSDQLARLHARLGAASGLSPEVTVGADPAAVDRRTAELGGVFVDLR